MIEELLCVVEIPMGSRNKYEWDEERGLILFDRFLSSSTVFPTDYGFVPESLGPDGEDPLDVLIAVSEPTFPGCGVIARPVAMMELEDQGAREPKIVCVPCEDPNWQQVGDLGDLPDQLVEEISHFFVAYKKRENHDVRVIGWGPRERAAAEIEQGYERFRTAHE
jgi:inorganic pyrophosphatase